MDDCMADFPTPADTYSEPAVPASISFRAKDDGNLGSDGLAIAMTIGNHFGCLRPWSRIQIRDILQIEPSIFK